METQGIVGRLGGMGHPLPRQPIPMAGSSESRLCPHCSPVGHLGSRGECPRDRQWELLSPWDLRPTVALCHVLSASSHSARVQGRGQRTPSLGSPVKEFSVLGPPVYVNCHVTTDHLSTSSCPFKLIGNACHKLGKSKMFPSSLDRANECFSLWP
jgi:hypothetical protein